MNAATPRNRFQAGPNLIAIPVMAAVFCTFAAGPVLASPEFRPPVHTKHHQAPRIDHKPAFQSALAAIRAQTRQNAALKGGNDDRERKAELDERKEELESRLEEITEEFLNSEESQDARDRIDEEEERRRAAKRENQEDLENAERELLNNPDEELRPACCVDNGGRPALLDRFMIEEERIDQAFDDAVDDILEDEMGAHDPDALDEYQKAKAELESARAELREMRQAQNGQGGQTPSGPGVVQP